MAFTSYQQITIETTFCFATAGGEFSERFLLHFIFCIVSPAFEKSINFDRSFFPKVELVLEKTTIKIDRFLECR